MKALGQELTQKEVEEILGMFDSDASQTIDFPEFVLMFREIMKADESA